MWELEQKIGLQEHSEAQRVVGLEALALFTVGCAWDTLAARAREREGGGKGDGAGGVGHDERRWNPQ